MRLSENRILAWIVLAACIAGSVFGLGGLHLRGERNDVLDVFYNGTKSGTERNSMDAYLDRAAECAQIMAYEAQLYLGEENQAAQNMLLALGDFGDDDSLDLRYDAYTRIQQNSDAIYNALYARKDLLDGERVNFKRAYDDFWGCDKYIRKDPYRDLASEYNKSITGFPANAAAAIAGAGKLNSFGG